MLTFRETVDGINKKTKQGQFNKKCLLIILDKICLSVRSDNPNLPLRYVSEEFLLSAPVSSQDNEEDENGDRDEGQRKVDRENERTWRQTLGPLVSLTKDRAQVRGSVAGTEKLNQSITTSEHRISRTNK
jgi:hypothetical protein